MSQRPPRPIQRKPAQKSGANGVLILLLLLAVASVVYVGFNQLAAKSRSGSAPSIAAGANPAAGASDGAAPGASATSAEAPTDEESGPPLVVNATPPPPFTPKTLADLQTIASGDPGDVKFQTLRTDTVGYTGCPQPKVYVLVSPENPQPKQLSSALLRFFFDQHLANDCGASLRAYKQESEAGGPGTRGEVTLDIAGNPQTPSAGHSQAHTIAINLPDRSSFNVSYTPS